MPVNSTEELGTCLIEGPLPREVLVCRIIAALVIIPLFIPALHKPLRRIIRPMVRNLESLGVISIPQTFGD